MNEENIFDRTESLRQLAKGGQTGRAAFVEIYNRYAPGIYRAGMQHLQSEALAEDLVQEVFSQLWSDRENFTHVRDLKNYLYVVAKNEAYRRFKQKASEAKIHEEYGERKAESLAGVKEDNVSEQYQHMLATLVELPPRKKQIFELAKLHGLSHKEIAERLDISPKTVNNHITEALRYLRKNGKLPITFIILLLLITA